MKASIQDKHILTAIRPLELSAYLRSTGWREIKVKEDRWAVWTKEGDFEITLPLNRTFGDFAQRMGDALRTLEAVEERSQLEILNDILTDIPIKKRKDKNNE